MTRHRVRCRLACELVVDAHVSRGIAVNVSERGLFVQTTTMLSIGTELEVRILETPERAAFAIPARVVHQKKVHPGAQLVVARGIGIEVLEVSDAWRALTNDMGCRSDEVPAGDPLGIDLPHFRVVLRRKDGIRIRTRIVTVACVDAEHARAGVESDLDEGWEIVRVDTEQRPGGAPLPLQRFRVGARRSEGAHRWNAELGAADADAARKAALGDLGTGWQIESVVLVAGDEPEDTEECEPSQSVAPEPIAASGQVFHVRARHQEGVRVRTRVLKIEADSPEQAAERVIAELGVGWNAVKVTAL